MHYAFTEDSFCPSKEFIYPDYIEEEEEFTCAKEPNKFDKEEKLMNSIESMESVESINSDRSEEELSTYPDYDSELDERYRND